MIGNRTEYPVNHANAYTNNTFSLPKTEKNLKRVMFNSFNYLKDLQKSYVSIHRFNLTEKDLYMDYNNKICFTIDKDFIDFSLRKEYRASSYYNKYVDLSVLCTNPDIFAYIPIIIIDSKSILSYEVKSSLDGTTTIRLPYILDYRDTYINTPHDIEVVFIKDLYMGSFITNVPALEANNWKLPPSLTGMTLTESQTIFMFLRVPGEESASNMYIGSVGQYGYIRIDKSNPSIYDFISTHRESEIIILAPSHIYEADGAKLIRNRVDIDKKSASLVISADEDGNTYNMPVPTENLFILKVNKMTGESKYENKRIVTLHYPNIYEIDSDDVDENVFEYKVFYVYRELADYLKYPNKMMFIHNFITSALGLNSLEEAVNKLLYETIEDHNLQEYFLSIFNYKDPIFTYDIDNFKKTEFPYDFDYKINKMDEFISNDPWSLKDYAADVSTPISVFYMYTKDIDLDSRVRMDTTSEATKTSDHIYFTEPHYVFAFLNDSSSLLNLRFFIDGDFCPNPTQIHSRFTDYIYIPVSKITSNSYIEIEKHYEYVYKKNLKFESTDLSIEVDFTKNPYVLPTLNDMYITDLHGNKIDRGKFKMYVMVDLGEFDISDYINKKGVETIGILLSEDLLIDESGSAYICLDDIFEPITPEMGSITLSDNEIVQRPKTRLPLKYVLLNKMRIFCTDNDLIGGDLVLNVNKTSHLYTTVLESNQTPSLEMFGYHDAYTNKKEFMRVFINGKYIPVEYNIVTKGSKEYIVPKCYVNKGDVISLDVTPFAYEMVANIKEIPDDFIVELDGYIDAPFDTKYYDIYLNGRKLSDNNVEAVTPTKLKLFNVHSRKNLYIFKRDRDYEFYGFKTYRKTLIDEFLSSDIIPDSYKTEFIKRVVKYRHGTVVDGDNSETSYEDLYLLNEESSNEYDFYFDVILPQLVAKPNSLILSDDEIKEKYPALYKKYSNGEGRLVLRPDYGYDSGHLLMIGKRYDGIRVL